MRPDERTLLTIFYIRSPGNQRPYMRALVHELGINEKRAAYICQKWMGKGLYEYGVNVLAGWLTDKGREAAEGLKAVVEEMAR
jgi:hypothetical protein